MADGMELEGIETIEELEAAPGGRRRQQRRIERHNPVKCSLEYRQSVAVPAGGTAAFSLTADRNVRIRSLSLIPTGGGLTHGTISISGTNQVLVFVQGTAQAQLPVTAGNSFLPHQSRGFNRPIPLPKSSTIVGGVTNTSTMAAALLLVLEVEEV